MDVLAFCLGKNEIYWSTVVLMFGALAAFCLMSALAGDGKRKEIFLFYPISVIFSLFLSRLIHWYCNSEQYKSFSDAFSNVFRGRFCFTGVVVGVVLAALLTKVLYRKADLKNLFDVCAPATVLFGISAALSCLFNDSCRGKYVLTDERFKGLPFSDTLSFNSEIDEYHLATFMIEAILLTAVLFLSLVFFFFSKRGAEGRIKGHTALMTLTFLSVEKIVTDSTRYDASYFRTNGFVSHTEIFFAACLLAVLIGYSIRSVKRRKINFRHFLLWFWALIMLGAAGFLEYLVQRHGNRFVLCYACMLTALSLVALFIYLLYGFTGKTESDGEASEPDKTTNVMLNVENQTVTEIQKISEKEG